MGEIGDSDMEDVERMVRRTSRVASRIYTIGATRPTLFGDAICKGPCEETGASTTHVKQLMIYEPIAHYTRNLISERPQVHHNNLACVNCPQGSEFTEREDCWLLRRFEIATKLTSSRAALPSEDKHNLREKIEQQKRLRTVEMSALFLPINVI